MKVTTKRIDCVDGLRVLQYDMFSVLKSLECVWSWIDRRQALKKSLSYGSFYFVGTLNSTPT